jgi:hypothetical protein
VNLHRVRGRLQVLRSDLSTRKQGRLGDKSLLAERFHTFPFSECETLLIHKEKHLNGC